MGMSKEMMDFLAFDQWRKSEQDTGEVAIERDHLMKAVMIAMKECPTEKQRMYIMHYYVEKMTIPQIAEMYGVAKSTVSRGIERGLKNMHRGLRIMSPQFRNTKFQHTHIKRREKLRRGKGKVG